MLTKDYIIQLLKTNDKAIARALLVLTARQTEDERQIEATRYRNGKGFRPCHAKMGVSMANFFKRNSYLSEKQVSYWRSLQKNGQMRIEIYAGQLLEVALEKTQMTAR